MTFGIGNKVVYPGQGPWRTDGEGIRRLINKSGTTGVLRQLARSTEQKTNWKQRDFFNLKRLSTGSAYDLAKVVESLTGLNERRRWRSASDRLWGEREDC